MSWLDILILVAIAVPVLIGLKVGIIKIVLSAVGAVIGVVLAGRYYAALASQLTFIPGESLARIAAFAIILVGVMVVAAIAAVVVGRIVSLVMLGWVNRLAGAVLGFVLGAVVCGAVLAIWVKYVGIAGPINDSFLAGVLLDGFPAVMALLPEEFGSVRAFFQ